MLLSAVRFVRQYLELKPGAIRRDSGIAERGAQMSHLFQNLLPRHVAGGLVKRHCDRANHATWRSRRWSMSLAISRAVRAVINSLSGIVTANSSSRANSNSKTRTDEKPAS